MSVLFSQAQRVSRNEANGLELMGWEAMRIKLRGPRSCRSAGHCGHERIGEHGVRAALCVHYGIYIIA